MRLWIYLISVFENPLCYINHSSDVKIHALASGIFFINLRFEFTLAKKGRWIGVYSGVLAWIRHDLESTK